MQASIEISMYPLDKEYGNHILSFIEALKQYEGITVRSNSMSTQIFGEYDLLMDIMKTSVKSAFSTTKTAVMVLKIVNHDLR